MIAPDGVIVPRPDSVRTSDGTERPAVGASTGGGPIDGGCIERRIYVGSPTPGWMSYAGPIISGSHEASVLSRSHRSAGRQPKRGVTLRWPRVGSFSQSDTPPRSQTR
jgi:hypothetical protein